MGYRFPRQRGKESIGSCLANAIKEHPNETRTGSISSSNEQHISSGGYPTEQRGKKIIFFFFQPCETIAPKQHFEPPTCINVRPVSQPHFKDGSVKSILLRVINDSLSTYTNVLRQWEHLRG